MTATDAPAIDEPDEITLYETGRVRVALAGKVYTLREVRFGELETLRGDYYSLVEQAQEAGPLRERMAALDASVVKWWLALMAMLGDQKPPTPKQFKERAPASWVTVAVVGQIVGHMMTFPLLRGATPTGQ